MLTSAKEKKNKRKGINQSPEIYGLNPWTLVQVVGFFLCWGSRKQPRHCPCRVMEDSSAQEPRDRAELPWLAFCCLSPVPAFTHGWQHVVFSQPLCWASSWLQLGCAAAAPSPPEVCWKAFQPNFCSASGKQKQSWQHEPGAAENWARFCDGGCSLPASFDELNIPAHPSMAGIIWLARNILLMQKKWVNMDTQGRIIDLLRPTWPVKSQGWKQLHVERLGCRGSFIFRHPRSFAARLYHWCNASRELWAFPGMLSPVLTYPRR